MEKRSALRKQIKYGANVDPDSKALATKASIALMVDKVDDVTAKYEQARYPDIDRIVINEQDKINSEEGTADGGNYQRSKDLIQLYPIAFGSYFKLALTLMHEFHHITQWYNTAYISSVVQQVQSKYPNSFKLQETAFTNILERDTYRNVEHIYDDPSKYQRYE